MSDTSYKSFDDYESYNGGLYNTSILTDAMSLQQTMEGAALFIEQLSQEPLTYPNQCSTISSRGTMSDVSCGSLIDHESYSGGPSRSSIPTHGMPSQQTRGVAPLFTENLSQEPLPFELRPSHSGSAMAAEYFNEGVMDLDDALSSIRYPDPGDIYPETPYAASARMIDSSRTDPESLPATFSQHTVGPIRSASDPLDKTPTIQRVAELTPLPQEFTCRECHKKFKYESGMQNNRRHLKYHCKDKKSEKRKTFRCDNRKIAKFL
ncbi:hypothetical protein N0V90_001528 [Kalmusia sp. IMI 367209]|nr:hypothetical protein N0V90_001528 [Kalmusia sp. IMI 367209]